MPSIKMPFSCYLFTCLCVAFTLLQLLERMVDFVMLGAVGSRWLMVMCNAVLGITTLSNVVNLCSYSASAYYLRRGYIAGTSVVADLQSPSFIQTQFLQCIFERKCKALDDYHAELGFDNKGLDTESVASICEFVSLIFIIVAYVVAGVHCIKRFRITFSNRVSSAGNARAMRQIISTVSTVFVTFLLRSGYAVILGISRFNNQFRFWLSVQNSCDNFCLPCQGLGNIVQAWDRLTPELRDVIFLLSSPLTMLVALWGTYSPSLSAVLFSKSQMSLQEQSSALQ